MGERGMKLVEYGSLQISNTIDYYLHEYERTLAHDEAIVLLSNDYDKCVLDKDSRLWHYMTDNDICREHAMDHLNEMAQDEFLGINGDPDWD
jgi:hypothetical protein